MGLFRYFPPPPPPSRLFPPIPSRSCSCRYQRIHWIRLLRVSRLCTQYTNLKYPPRSWLLAEVNKQSKQSKQTGICNNFTRIEIPEVISAEQHCFIVSTFFSADSEKMINISADQLCFRADQLWFSLNKRCSELKNSALFQSWTALFQSWTALFQSWTTLFQSWTTLFQRETALNQRCSALIFLTLKHWIFSAEQSWFSADLLWISSDIYTCRWDYQNMIT